VAASGVDLPAETCEELCPIGESTQTPAFQCLVGTDEASTPFLACHYCVVGRRAEGHLPAVPAEGTPLGAFFADVSHLEAASVDAFRTLAAELARHGAPQDLVLAAERSSRDEIRHARATGELARRFGAESGDWAAPP